MSKEALTQTPIHTLSPEPPVERDARWHNVHRQLHHVWNVACGLSQGDRSDLEGITNHIVRLLRRSAPGPTIEVAYASCGNIERRSYTIEQAAARLAELEEHCERVGLEAAMAAQQLAAATARACVDLMEIPAQDGLDPIRVIFCDHEPGKGTLIVQCYSQAWTCYFGGMGKDTLREFVASVDRHYLSGALRIKGAAYGQRIANAVILACRAALAPAAEVDGE